MFKKIAECKFGYYGKDCMGGCSVNCYYTNACDRFTGRCNGGCKTGWMGSKCDQRTNCFFFYFIFSESGFERNESIGIF